MATETLWESNDAASGLHVRAELGSAGLVLTIRRRVIMLEKDAPPTTGWTIGSQLMIWWPCPIDEAMRLISALLGTYNESLRASLRPLAEKLAAIPDPANKGSVPPPVGLPS